MENIQSLKRLCLRPLPQGAAISALSPSGQLLDLENLRQRSQRAVVALVLCLLLVALGLVSDPLPAEAQGLTTAPAVTQGLDQGLSPTAGSTADAIAADKVDQFAQAYLKVLKLLSDREPELPAAETSAEAFKIEQSIEAEAMKLIQESGLSVSEYMEILGLASQDTSFRDKILAQIDESM